MRVYVVIAEDREDINFDDDCSCLVRKVYGVYLLEAMADAACIEAQEHHDYAYSEAHFVE